MLLLLAAILLIIAIAGGVIIHPLLFVLAIVGVKDHVGDGLGHGESDRVPHFLRGARSYGEGRDVMSQLTDDGRHRRQYPFSALPNRGAHGSEA